jgi:uncharacterized protein
VNEAKVQENQVDEPARFQILALDGGGAKALFTAHVLARLEVDLGTSIRDSFDLIAGTSAGGIIALALGAGIPPAEIVARYSDLVATVFPRKRRLPTNLPRRLLGPTYDPEALRSGLADLFGETKLGDSTRKLVIPSWDAQNGGVHLFKTPHHPDLTRDWRLPMVDVAMATSAAPTYFPAAQVDGQRFIDGGIWANNPSVVAIAEAVSMLGVPLTSIKLLNVGTTDHLRSNSKRLDRGGLLAWAPHVVSLVLSAGSKGGQGTARHLVGDDNYSHFDAIVEGGAFSIDKANVDDIAGVAAAASKKLSPLYKKRFLDHTAQPFTSTLP